jgi:hypothetical protein
MPFATGARSSAGRLVHTTGNFLETANPSAAAQKSFLGENWLNTQGWILKSE